MKVKPLSGRESSILALLAQALELSSSDKSRILSELDGRALKIARAIIGDKRFFSKDIHKAADGFISWAASLKIGSIK